MEVNTNYFPHPQRPRPSEEKENIKKNFNIRDIALAGSVRARPVRKVGSKLTQSSVTTPAPDVKKMTKQIEGSISFPYVPARLDIPKKLLSLSPKDRSKLERACFEDYRKALMALEEAVTDVAVAHPASLAYSKELAKRLLSFLEAYAAVLLEDEGKIASKSSINLKVNALLVSLFTGKREEGRGTIEEGLQKQLGNIGTNPLSIRKVFVEGNFREQMYLPFRMTVAFTQKIFADPVLVEKINGKLKGWQLDTKVIQDMTREGREAYKYSPYADQSRSAKLRLERSAEEKKEAIKENPRIKDESALRIPLSERERRFSTSELTPESTRLSPDLEKIYRDKSEQTVLWQKGSHLYRVSLNKERTTPHKYLTAAEQLQFPSVTGISGTLDQFFTLNLCFGMSSQKELETSRLAVLGWLLDGGAHSINEVMTSSRGFGFDYVASPTSYKEIYPQDTHFVEKVKAAQTKRGMQLPEFYLSSEFVQEKAKELGF